jgi:hypothetical protein
MFKLPSIVIALLLSFNALADKSPHGIKFNIKCDLCHNPDSWAFKVKDNSFDHNLTSFPLAGQHKDIECRKCHVDLVFSNAKTTCISCHKDIHQQTVGQDCERCHNPRSWLVTNITEVHRQSRFPLNGQHAQVDCYRCHKSASLLRFDPMGAECSDCHTKDFAATTNPPHTASKFPKDCILCHSEKGWQPAQFNHNTSTTFPLTGGHMGIDCNSCHSNGYVGISTECVSCHIAKYNATTNPNHTTAKFPTDCKICHNTTAWQPSTFDHSTSNFPLTGGHIGVSCISCHSKGYVGTPTACESCHLTDYNATTNPPHIAAKFPTDCKICHTPTAWQPSTFNHNTSTTFPIVGAHIGVSCISCHANGYVGISTDCYSCHAANYNATTNPIHSAVGFPTTCLTCHTQNGWTPATYNHDAQFFPIYSGRHKGQWTLCSDCHTNPTNYAVFNCLLCHAHSNKAAVDANHSGVSGYVYNSTNCLACHPRGTSD